MCRICDATPAGRALRTRVDHASARVRAAGGAADPHLVAALEAASAAYVAHHDHVVLTGLRGAQGAAFVHLRPHRVPEEHES